MKTLSSGTLRQLRVAAALCALFVSSCGRSDLGQAFYESRYGKGDVADAGDADRSDGWADARSCTTAYDCDDRDFCTMEDCVDGFCRYDPKDLDHDGSVDALCGGDDCNDNNPNVRPGVTENCSDGADNDCNGVSDCFDPYCESADACGCVPDPAGEDCYNGVDDDCNQYVDCGDPSCIGTPACGCTTSESGACHNGIDDDCDGQLDCQDSDCEGDAGCVCASKQEICDNGQDDDCNLLIDCADPHCAGSSVCACIPPGTPELCADKVDNDCDLLVDCADPDCANSSACQMCAPEICDDGIDNDCDNIIDCADDSCVFDAACQATSELCNNGLDDDLDTAIDCADPDCKGNPWCTVQHDSCLNAKLISASGTYTGDTTGHTDFERGQCGGHAGEAVFYLVLNAPTKVLANTDGTEFDSTLYLRKGSCQNGEELACDDDSGDGWAAKVALPILYPGTYFLFVDGYVFGSEGHYILNVELTPNPNEVCDNGQDDDGDVFVDCADPDCATIQPCIQCNSGMPPQPEFSPEACTDGVDNDCDGLVDCDDGDCRASEYYEAECCNGLDDNGNGIVDEFACRCTSDLDCADGNRCYTHTTHTCSLDCIEFVGHVCPFVAPGSHCSSTTQQCEFL